MINFGNILRALFSFLFLHFSDAYQDLRYNNGRVPGNHYTWNQGPLTQRPFLNYMNPFGYGQQILPQANPASPTSSPVSSYSPNQAAHQYNFHGFQNSRPPQAGAHQGHGNSQYLQNFGMNGQMFPFGGSFQPGNQFSRWSVPNFYNRPFSAFRDRDPNTQVLPSGFSPQVPVTSQVPPSQKPDPMGLDLSESTATTSESPIQESPIQESPIQESPIQSPNQSPSVDANEVQNPEDVQSPSPVPPKVERPSSPVNIPDSKPPGHLTTSPDSEKSEGTNYPDYDDLELLPEVTSEDDAEAKEENGMPSSLPMTPIDIDVRLNFQQPS